jgi:phenylalanyl-tRNA synthetase beta chain
LFEISRVFLAGRELPEERVTVAGLCEGGFFRAKGVVETLCAALKIEPVFTRAEDALLHPGKSAAISAGSVGELHPRLLEGEWAAFELDLERLFEGSREPVTYRDVITYPVVRQDIAVVVDESVEAGAIVEAARQAAGPELREARVFDVYRGEQAGPGRKSVAFSVAYQSAEGTLADEDATRLRASILAALRERFGAEVRA